MGIGERLSELLATKNKKPGTLASETGISKNTIYSIIKRNNEKVDYSIIEKIAAALEVPVEYFFPSSSPRTISHPPAVIPSSSTSEYIRIPVVGSVKAGIPTEAVEDVIDWEDIPRSQAMRGDYIGLRVKGNSMEPRICEGDTVIIRRQETIENGELAVVLVNGDEATLKKVKIEDGGIILVAFNPSVYEPKFYSRQQIDELPVRIYGKVVELRGKF